MCHICHSSIYIHVRESSCNSLQSHEKQRTPHYSDAFTRFTGFSDHCGEILDHSSSQHYFSSLRFTGICLCTALPRTRCSSKVGLRTQFRPSIRCWRDGLTDYFMVDSMTAPCLGSLGVPNRHPIHYCA